MRAAHDWQSLGAAAPLRFEHRVYQRDVPDGHLSVIVSREAGWHLSISHRTNELRPRPGRYPTWDEITDARYQFCPNEATMAMLLPPREEYVNLHETTFHLWEVPGGGADTWKDR